MTKFPEYGERDSAARKKAWLTDKEAEANYRHQSCWFLTDTIVDLREALRDLLNESGDSGSWMVRGAAAVHTPI